MKKDVCFFTLVSEVFFSLFLIKIMTTTDGRFFEKELLGAWHYPAVPVFKANGTMSSWSVNLLHLIHEQNNQFFHFKMVRLFLFSYQCLIGRRNCVIIIITISKNLD